MSCFEESPTPLFSFLLSPNRQKRVALTAEVSRSLASCVRSKESIQQCLRVCEEHGGVRAMDPDHYDADDNMVDDKIFCGVCGKREISEVSLDFFQSNQSECRGGKSSASTLLDRESQICISGFLSSKAVGVMMEG